VVTGKRNIRRIEWTDGTVPLGRNETHDEVVEMMEKECRGKVLDVPTGTEILAARLKKIAFEVSCCDINASYFSVPSKDEIIQGGNTLILRGEKVA
jgi:hypothetical protein